MNGPASGKGRDSLVTSIEQRKHLSSQLQYQSGLVHHQRRIAFLLTIASVKVCAVVDSNPRSVQVALFIRPT